MAIDAEDDEPPTPPHKVSLEDRVRSLERDTRAHARSFTEIVKVGHDHDTEIKRIGAVVHGHEKELQRLSAWQTTRLIAEAREEERDKSLYGRLDRIDASIQNIRGAFVRVLWIVAGVVITAAVYEIAAAIVHGVPT